MCSRKNKAKRDEGLAVSRESPCLSSSIYMQRPLVCGVEVKQMPPDKAMLSLLAVTWLCLSVLGTLMEAPGRLQVASMASHCVAEPPLHC